MSDSSFPHSQIKGYETQPLPPLGQAVSEFLGSPAVTLQSLEEFIAGLPAKLNMDAAQIKSELAINMSALASWPEPGSAPVIQQLATKWLPDFLEGASEVTVHMPAGNPARDLRESELKGLIKAGAKPPAGLEGAQLRVLQHIDNLITRESKRAVA